MTTGWGQLTAWQQLFTVCDLVKTQCQLVPRQGPRLTSISKWVGEPDQLVLVFLVGQLLWQKDFNSRDRCTFGNALFSLHSMTEHNNNHTQ